MSESGYLLQQVAPTVWWSHAGVIVLNFLLWWGIGPWLSYLERGLDVTAKIRAFRALNLLLILVVLGDLLWQVLALNDHPWLLQLGISLLCCYLGLLALSTSAFFCRRRFGRERQVDDELLYLDTYASRLVSLLAAVLIIALVVYAWIRIWGFDSWLEATGLVGILLAFVALTSGVWAPDLLSGLIILNSEMLEDGDVVVIEGYRDEYIIHKVSFIYVVLYDVRNNHRVLIRNSQFIRGRLDNLSRIASSDGIRLSLTFKVGYPAQDALDATARVAAVDALLAMMERAFQRVSQAALANAALPISHKKEPEWALTETGDDALSFTLFVYLQRLPNTKLTAKIRKHLIAPRHWLLQAVWREAAREGIALATPRLWEGSVTLPPPVPAAAIPTDPAAPATPAPAPPAGP